ncbi:hypothetical protein YQE_09335, partial [Dendroctonus ponderosae]
MYLCKLRITNSVGTALQSRDCYSGMYQFSIPTLVIKDPELLKQLTVRDFDHFTDHRILVDADADPLWSGNLFALTGRKWKDMRATLSGSFSSSKIKRMFHVMNGAAENFVIFFLNKNETLIEVEMRDTFSRFANDIIATTAFGIEVDSLKSPNNPFHIMGKRITDYSSLIKRLRFFAFLIAPRVAKLLKIGLFEKDISSFFYKTIKETIQVREEKGIVREDMLNILLEARKGTQHEYSAAIETGFATVKEYTHSGKGSQFANLTDDDIAAQAMVFYVAGFETISNALCFGSYELAVNKEIQNKLRSEIVETHRLNGGKVTYDSLLKMKYMDMVISVLAWFRFLKPMNHFTKLGVKQSKPWPIVGDQWTHMFQKMSLLESIEFYYNMFPGTRYSGIYQFHIPTLIIKDPELLKQLTVRDFDHFTDHRTLVDADVDPLWAGNLFALTGRKWKDMRATLSGSFTSSKIKKMFHFINGTAENFVAFFLNKNEKLIEVEMRDTFSRFANDIIATTAFGIEVDSLKSPSNPFHLMGKRITDYAPLLKRLRFFAILIMPKLTKFFNIGLFDKELSSFFYKSIKETIQVREEKGIVRRDMLNTLLEARKGIQHEYSDAIETGFATVKESAHSGQGIDFANLTDADLAAQAMVFYLAGFDTISNAMCFGSYELAVNKEIQNKLRSEIVETHRLNGGKVTYDSLLKMKYMDKVISVLMWFLFLKPMNHFTRMGVKQSTPWPIVGDLWTNIFWQMSLLESIEFSYNMFPGVRYSGFYQFSIPTLIIKDPELLKQLTIRDFDHFTDHRALIDADVDPLWAGHLFALTGRKWKDMRSTLSGSFSSSKIKNLFNLMNGAAENFVTFFLNKNEKLIEVEMRDTFSRFANDIIATTAFGIEVDSLKSPNNPFHLLGKRITDYSSLVKRLRFFAILIMPKLTKLLNIGLFEKELSSFFYKTVKETIQAREEQGIVRQDMLNVLLEARKGIQHEYSDAIETGFATVKEYTHSGKGPQFANLTDADLAAQAMVFYLAGFDTISNAMSFGSYELAINKEIQNKLRSEIVETHKLNDGKITYDSLLKMQYMDKVISAMIDCIAESTLLYCIPYFLMNFLMNLGLTFGAERYSGFYQFSVPTLMLKDPELIKQITVKDFDHFTDHRAAIDPELEPLFARNLFTLKGPKWRQMRSTLSGSFTSSKMKNMFSLMNEAAEHFTKFFLNQNKETIEIEMKDTYSRFTNDVIATTAFGIKVDSLEDTDNLFYSMGKDLTNFNSFTGKLRILGIMLAPKLFKALKIGLFPTKFKDFFTNVIYETIETREKQGIVRQDMINLLMEARKGIEEKELEVLDTGFATVKETPVELAKNKQIQELTNLDIAAQAMIFFFAGFDAISTVMCFGTYELAVNQDVQDKLRKEILATHKANNGKLTYESLLKMKYMDMVVSEMLRKWPAGPGIDRVTTKPYTIEPVRPGEEPVHLTPGDVLFLPTIGLHRDPAFYPNPMKFDPERFSDENKGNIIPYTYTPFGAGPRNCIGSRFALLEIKALFYHVLLNFKIEPTEKTLISLVLCTKSFNSRAKGGFWYAFKRINNGLLGHHAFSRYHRAIQRLVCAFASISINFAGQTFTMLWLILLITLAVLIWFRFLKPMNHFTKMGVKQTKPWPIFGDQWRTVFRQMSFLDSIEYYYNMFPGTRYSGFYQFSIPTLITKDPELIKQITVKDFDHFSDHRSFVDADVDPLWAGNLFALTGQKWKEMRATLSGSFTSSKMKNMFHLMNGAAENFVNFFLSKNEELIEVEMKNTFTRFTNDIIATTAFGIEVDSLKYPNNDFYLMGKRTTDFSSLSRRLRFFAFLMVPKLTKFLRIGLFDKEISSFFYKTIKETIQVREETGIVRQDMLHLLLEARKGIQHEHSDAIETGFATVKEYTQS